LDNQPHGVTVIHSGPGKCQCPAFRDKGLYFGQALVWRPFLHASILTNLVNLSIRNNKGGFGKG
jgi:hypothetical protein